MKRLFLGAWLFGTFILLIVGYNEIINAVSYGLKMGAETVIANSGMDGASYQRLVEETIRCHQIAGSILAAIGGIGVTISLYEIRKEIK